MSDDLARVELKSHAAGCEQCFTMLQHYDAYEEHVLGCEHCSNLTKNKDYCLVGNSLQQAWIGELFDKNEEPRCIVGDELINEYLDGNDDDDDWKLEDDD